MTEHGGRVDVDSTVGRGTTFTHDAPRHARWRRDERSTQPLDGGRLNLSSTPPARILIAEDEANLRLVLQKELERAGPHACASRPTAKPRCAVWKSSNVDVLLCDINMPRMDGMELLRRVHERPNPPEVIMLTGHATVETAIEAMKLGAYDYLSKPYRITELDALVKQAAEKRRLRVDNQRLRAATRAAAERDAGDRPRLRRDARGLALGRARRAVGRLSPHHGRIGDGQGIDRARHPPPLAAQRRLVHRSQLRGLSGDRCLESELFGYEAGAFSGAKARKLGLFELADGGTLFLDEITELPAPLQSKLLRAIETRSFFRVGGVRKVQVNVRIVAATNRDVNQVVADGTFRADLLYRVNSFQINLAPLARTPRRHRAARAPPA